MPKYVICFASSPYSQKAKDLNLKDILAYIRSHAGDRDAWNMADEGISLFENADPTSAKYKGATGMSPSASGSVSSLLKLRDIAEGTKQPDDVKMPFGSAGVLPGYGDGDGSEVPLHDRPGTSAMGSSASVRSKSTEGAGSGGARKDVQL